MQFNTAPNQPIIEKTWWGRFTSQPHQMFFSSAIFFALLVMTLTLFTFIGIGNFDFSLIHGFGLNYALFTNAFLGFLITVMPKYNSTAVIAKNKYIYSWIFYQLGLIIALFVNELFGKIIVSFIIFYFVKLFYEIIKNANAIIKEDSIYINSILFFGGILLLIEALFSTNLSNLIFFAYLLSMVFIISLRMIPAFFFSFTRVPMWQLPKYVKPISILLLITTGFALHTNNSIFISVTSFLGSIFFGFVIYKLNLFRKVPAILYILSIALFWFEVAYICLFLENIFIEYSFKLSFHIFALGFVTTLLIGFGSRVSLGHAVPAQPIVADSFTKLLFVLTQIVLFLRVMTSIGFILNSNIYTMFLHASSTLWILLFILWLFKFGKYLLRIKA
ncbi:NnrS family protein [Arcobacter sp. CECT 8985]|uniref:NnrS family protein n=1 Tax=Arcobacter sp. CECT 8985 TaxID=1935424 RepID=UPI00100B6DED|nr:NnrS family protein [Arcobacter sp. CECT 8985]RXJ87771.1 hypothetical protein CRU93_02965 [Arcobacter sp. CECT 8985]